MRKVLILSTIVIIAGYIAYQNWPVWALQLAGKASPVQIGAGQTYKDGTYIGSPADAIYGNIQIQVIVSGGKIAHVTFLQSPSDRGTSIAINSYADPILAQEAISAQGNTVDVVSGATDSSQAFIQSLQTALAQAK